MAIVVRPADLETDRELLIDFMLRYLSPLAGGRRFDWLYRENPHGAARVWVAVDEQNHSVVGASTVFPRRIYAGGSETLGCVLGDFCIHPHYRSLGPALQLQRATLEGVRSGGLALGYDFPSATMMSVYKRLGVEAREQMVRLAKPLRVDRRIVRAVKVHPLARALSAVGNLALELQDRRLNLSGAWRVSVHRGMCGQEFSALARQMGDRLGVCVVRSAEYLNWRYLVHPHRRHEILVARREGALFGYVILGQAGEDAALVDLFGVEETEMLSSLVGQVVALLRKRGAVTLSAPMAASHPWVALLNRLGFCARESCPVVLYAPPQTPARACPANGPKWFLMDGDRES